MSGPVLTTTGLKTGTAAAVSASTLTQVQWSAAVGTANAIRASFATPITQLYDGLIVGVRAKAANTSTTPTFSPDGLTAYTIVKGANAALQPGDIPGDAAEILLRFNVTLSKWILLNPFTDFRKASAFFAESTGSADALVAAFDPVFAALQEGQIVVVRANNANTASDPTLAVDALTARIIYKSGQQALSAGDIAQYHDAIFSYHADATPWFELLNPVVASASGSFVTAGGTANAITATFSPAITTLYDGLRVTVRAAADNTAANVTFSPNSLTARRIYKKDQQSLAAFDIAEAMDMVLIFHDDTTDWWELTNPTGGNQTQAITSDDSSDTANDTSDQSWFPAANNAVTLSEATTYEFEGLLYLTRAAGTTSHTTGIKYGGTATFDRFFATIMANDGDDALSGLVTHKTIIQSDPATAAVAKTASTSATEKALFRVKGRLKVAAAGGGTFIPEFVYSAAPGGAPTRKVGTFFSIRPSPVEGIWG